MIVQKSSKVVENYECEHCHYTTSRRYDFNKHLSTDKHKMVVMVVKSSTDTPHSYVCSCGKKYKYDSGFYRHKKTCKIDNEFNMVAPIAENTNQLVVLEPVTSSDDIVTIDKTLFVQMMKDNHELKEMLMVELNKIKTEPTTINNHNHINNTNYNTFNLQFFLNEQCKDAINMIDFINTLEFGPTSVEYTGRHGYVEGITKLIIDGLKEMDIYKRPIHCTDIKRETLYIKEENKWEKDNDEKTKFRTALRDVVHKNIQQIRHWRDHNPRCEIMETNEYEFHLIVMQQCIGGGSGKQEPNDNKIIKNIANYVLIDKSKEGKSAV